MDGRCSGWDEGTCYELNLFYIDSWLTTHGSNFTCLENLWEVGPAASQAPGVRLPEPSAVCIPDWHWHGGWHHLPASQSLCATGEATKHCEDNVFDFSSAFNTSSQSGWLRSSQWCRLIRTLWHGLQTTSVLPLNLWLLTTLRPSTGGDRAGECHILCRSVRGGGTGNVGAIKLNKLERKASSDMGMKLDSVQVVTERRMRGKLQAIMDNPSRPLYAELRQLRSTYSHRPIQLRPSKCLGGSFILSAIRLHNTTTIAPNTSFLH